MRVTRIVWFGCVQSIVKKEFSIICIVDPPYRQVYFDFEARITLIQMLRFGNSMGHVFTRI